MSAEFRKGDRVRVDFEATFDHRHTEFEDLAWVKMLNPSSGGWVPADALTLVDPAWQPGDVVRDEDGAVLLRSGDCWYHGMAAYHPRGRLTRLMPEDRS